MCMGTLDLRTRTLLYANTLHPGMVLGGASRQGGYGQETQWATLMFGNVTALEGLHVIGKYRNRGMQHTCSRTGVRSTAGNNAVHSFCWQ